MVPSNSVDAGLLAGSELFSQALRLPVLNKPDAQADVELELHGQEQRQALPATFLVADAGRETPALVLGVHQNLDDFRHNQRRMALAGPVGPGFSRICAVVFAPP